MRSSLLALPALLLASSALAQGTTPAADTSYLVPYVGVFDVLDDNSNYQFGLEYRYKDVFYGLRPTVGFNADDEGATYIYGGINWDIPLGYSFTFTPNFMVGDYSDNGNGKRLGGPIEFRSGLELSYALPNESRVGVSFNHISNASIYDNNPGGETLLINYQIPLGWFTGN